MDWMLAQLHDASRGQSNELHLHRGLSHSSMISWDSTLGLCGSFFLMAWYEAVGMKRLVPVQGAIYWR